MLIGERHQKIIDLVNQKKFLSSKDLRTKLYISEATIRRDLADLEKNGLLTRTRGGAMAIESSSSEQSIVLREQLLVKEKRSIANIALGFIKNGSSYFFDSSTTVGQMIPLLSLYKNITAITNGINNALLLSSINNNVLLIGGQVSTRTNSTLGSGTINQIDNYYCNTFIFSCSGLSISGGLTEINIEQSLAKQKMLTNSEFHVLLIDHTKFDHTYTAKTCEIQNIHVIITDQEPPKKYLELFDSLRIKCLYP